MMTHLAAAAANCARGSWAQQWQCKWNAGLHQPPTAAVTRAGFDFGHNVLPVAVVLLFLILAVRLARSRKSAPKVPARR